MKATPFPAFVLGVSFLLGPSSRAAPSPVRELTEAQAVKALTSFVGSNGTYGCPAGSIHPKVLEYRNAGYTVDLVAERCPGSPDGTLLGRWRVDARNGDLYVRNEKGKFVAPAPPAQAGNATAGVSVREERTVVVDGVGERWRLEWAGKTEPVCSPESGWDQWGMCPCAGFEFGEDGDLDLVRSRPGASDERLRLTPFFRLSETPGRKAVLKRWPVQEGDEGASSRPGFAARVRARALAPAMILGDYDHDGRATEFVLQIGAGPCGHRQSIVVGLSPGNPRLHAFASVEEPRVPLVLEGVQAWEKLRQAAGAVNILLWGCGDHGGDTETTVRLLPARDGIHAKVNTKECP